jgi:hypothetical protein
MKKWLMILGLSACCAAQPLLPDPEQCLSSPGMERLAGSLFAQRFEKGGMGFSPEILPADHPDTKLVQRVTDRLSKVVAYDRPGMRLQAKVVVSKEINAFCIPAGYIYVYTGLLEHIRKQDKQHSEEMLAGIMGHEIAHAVMRHSIQSWRDVKDFKAVLSDPQIFQKTMLAMSRAQEFEADRYGLLYALRAGYAVTPIFSVYEKLPEMPNRLAANESDHPSNSERVKQLKKYANQLKQLLGLWQEANQSALTGQLVEARTVLEILAAELPNLASVHNNLGWVYYQLYEREAHPAFRVSPSLCQELGITVRGGAEVHPMLAKADDEFLLASQCDPDMQSARVGLATCAVLRGDLDGATKLLAGYTSDVAPEVHNLRGVIAQQRGGDGKEHFAAAASYLPALFNSGQYAAMLALEPTGYWADQARLKSGASALPKVSVRQEAAGVRLGMSATEVAKKLGKPESEEKLESSTFRQSYRKLGLELWLGQDGLRAIRWEPHGEDGLKVGMSIEELRSKWGAPANETTLDAGLTAWSYPGRGVVVEMQEGKLAAVLLGRR